MRLFHYPHAPYSRKALVAAFERDVAFEDDVCPPWDAAAKERIRAVHPLASVPLLVDGDVVVAESSLIAEYFDIAAGGGVLLPASRALAIRGVDRFADTQLGAPTAYLGWATRRPPTEHGDAKIKKQRAQLAAAMDWLERRVVLELDADRPTLADISVACPISCMLVDGTIPNLDAWPKTKAWYARMIARPSWLRLLDVCRAFPLPPGFG